MDPLSLLGITVTSQGLQMNTNTLIFLCIIVIILLVVIQRKLS